MQVSKWGDSLAIRLPAAVVEAHKLKEGDEIEVSIAGKRDFKTTRDRGREKAIESLPRLARRLPPGFKFDREELNER
jgi:antitoxin MazE